MAFQLHLARGRQHQKSTEAEEDAPPESQGHADLRGWDLRGLCVRIQNLFRTEGTLVLWNCPHSS